MGEGRANYYDLSWTSELFPDTPVADEPEPDPDLHCYETLSEDADEQDAYTPTVAAVEALVSGGSCSSFVSPPCAQEASPLPVVAEDSDNPNDYDSGSMPAANLHPSVQAVARALQRELVLGEDATFQDYIGGAAELVKWIAEQHGGSSIWEQHIEPASLQAREAIMEAYHRMTEHLMHRFVPVWTNDLLCHSHLDPIFQRTQRLTVLRCTRCQYVVAWHHFKPNGKMQHLHTVLNRRLRGLPRCNPVVYY